MPKIDMKAKFAAMNDKVKKARMPSPHELREGYLNSTFHKSFQQPLTVRTREMDDPEELEQRQVICSLFFISGRLQVPRGVLFMFREAFRALEDPHKICPSWKNSNRQPLVVIEISKICWIFKNYSCCKNSQSVESWGPFPKS